MSQKEGGKPEKNKHQDYLSGRLTKTGATGKIEPIKVAPVEAPVPKPSPVKTTAEPKTTAETPATTTTATTDPKPQSFGSKLVSKFKKKPKKEKTAAEKVVALQSPWEREGTKRGAVGAAVSGARLKNRDPKTKLGGWLKRGIYGTPEAQAKRNSNSSRKNQSGSRGGIS